MELDLQGWMFEAEQKWLYETAYRLPDDATIVEIGSWKGLSTSCLCRGCLHSRKKVYAVDHWQGSWNEMETHFANAKTDDIFKIFQSNMNILGYSEIVSPLKGESGEIARRFDRTIDFLFIDGAHDEISVSRDITSWIIHCKRDAIVAGHDFAAWAPGVVKVIKEKFRVFRLHGESIWRSSPQYYLPPLQNLKENIKFTFIIISYNYCKRLKLCLASLALQTFPKNQFEIIIANPESPDKLHTMVCDFKKKHPVMPIKEVVLEKSISLNRGKIYNELAWEAGGETLCLMDADAVLPPDGLQQIDQAVLEKPQLYHSCFRRDVPIEVVERFIVGELNLKDHFEILQTASRSIQESSWSSFKGKIGFLQIVNKETFLKTGYKENFYTVAESDLEFANRYIWHSGDRRYDYRIPGLTVFHLDHIRNWGGVSETQ
ncbi:MAG: hypothetical protein CV087_08165 [Candidatus Brocadia sp. WS118]|nr:MAG: hypothetical protein CV087_08165 [Candidatus Brocadia sp. WS118]